MKFKLITFLLVLITNTGLFSQSDTTITINTGYNIVDKSALTTPIIQVNQEDFNVGNINNPYLLLQGKVAGLLVAKPDGDPLSTPEVRIRNINSLSNNQRPLIIVDGIPDFDWTMLDPNDIERIEVLKDIASTAIYGIRGGNGVILVTTKKKSTKKLHIQYRAYFSHENPIRSDIMSAETYRQEITSISSFDLGASTDWMDVVTRAANSTAHHLSFYGKNNSTTYQLNLNYRNINGTLINDKSQQYNVSAAIQHKALNDKLTANIGVNMMRKNYQPTHRATSRYIQKMAPTVPVYDDTNPDSGNYYEIFNFDNFNPLSIAEQILIEGQLNNTNINAGISYEILDGLELQSLYSLQTLSEKSGVYIPNTSYYIGQWNNGIASKNEQTYSNHFYEALLSYNKKIGPGALKIISGYNFQQKDYSNIYKESPNYLPDYETFKNTSVNDLMETPLSFFGTYEGETTLHSFLTSANYEIDNTYFINVNYRRDNLSSPNVNIAASNSFGVSGGVNLATLINSPNINQLKIRLGYGQNGNLPIIGNVQRNLQTTSYVLNTNFVDNYNYPQLTQGISVEKNAAFFMGFDINIFDGLVDATFDYYIATAFSLVSEVVFFAPFPTIAFFNTGEIQSNGMEIALNIHPIKTDNFQWSIAANLTTSKNILVEIDNSPDNLMFRTGNFDSPGFDIIFSNLIAEGQPIGQFYGLQFEGINQNGEWEFKDLDNNGNSFFDQAVIGNGLPNAYYGLTNILKYKDVDFSFLLRGASGHQLANELRLFQQNYFFPNTYNTTNSALESQHRNLTETNQWSDYFIEDATFLKVEYISLGYTLEIKSAKVRLYVAANNLYTFTKYTGTNPEVRLSHNNNLFAAGRDSRDMYAPSRGFLFGVEANF